MTDSVPIDSNGFFSDDKKKYTDLNVSEDSPNRIGEVMETFNMYEPVLRHYIKVAKVQFRDMHQNISMDFVKTFIKIRQPNKNELIVARYDRHSSFNLIPVYNTISSTYMGTTIDCFVNTLRGIERSMPGFFENFCESDATRSLLEAGFEETMPSAMDNILYRQAT